MKKILIIAIMLATFSVWINIRRDASPTAPTMPAITEKASTTEPTVSISPRTIQQGDPILVVVNGVDLSASSVSMTFNSEHIPVFLYNKRPSAFIGIDLKMSPGAYPLIVTLADGRVISTKIDVTERIMPPAPLGIPEKLGGNTPEGEQNVVTSLARENAIIAAIPSTNSMLWSERFGYPLDSITVTDPYGYSRLTGASTISHKGTDLRAAKKTPVFAMNDGVVRLVDKFTIYGTTIIIDHGFGLQTLYMHLTSSEVSEGDTVTKGQLIGLSGMSGYAEQPHLHISIKIDGISIDPMRFLGLFDEKSYTVSTTDTTIDHLNITP